MTPEPHPQRRDDLRVDRPPPAELKSVARGCGIIGGLSLLALVLGGFVAVYLVPGQQVDRQFNTWITAAGIIGLVMVLVWRFIRWDRGRQ